MTDRATQKHIQKVLAGADEITERFGSHQLQNGMTVAQNMVALAQMLAELTLSASESSDHGRKRRSQARRGIASEGKQ